MEAEIQQLVEMVTSILNFQVPKVIDDGLNSRVQLALKLEQLFANTRMSCKPPNNFLRESLIISKMMTIWTRPAVKQSGDLDRR
jgi:hypothetical protein